MKHKDILKAWDKMVLNSIYFPSPISDMTILYDVNKSRTITEEGKNFLNLLINATK